MLPHGFSFPPPPPPPVVQPFPQAGLPNSHDRPPPGGQWTSHGGGFSRDRGSGHTGQSYRGARGDSRGRGRGGGRGGGFGDNRGGRGGFGAAPRGGGATNKPSFREDFRPGTANRQHRDYQQKHKSGLRANPSAEELHSFPSAPAVPSFGLPIPSLGPAQSAPAPTESASSPPPSKKQKPNSKRKSNLLGLTPKGEDYEPSDDDAKEEAAFVARTGDGALQFEYKGQMSMLGSAEDIKKWIAERKAKWPTRARIEEKQKEEQERRAEMREVRMKALESQRDAALKSRIEREEKRKLEAEKVKSEATEVKLEVDDELPDERASTKKRKRTKARRERAKDSKYKASIPQQGELKLEPSDPLPAAQAPIQPTTEIQPDIKAEPMPEAEQKPPPQSSDITQSETKATPAPPPLDPALAARRARIEALRKQLEEEEQEMALASLPSPVEPQVKIKQEEQDETAFAPTNTDASAHLAAEQSLVPATKAESPAGPVIQPASDIDNREHDSHLKTEPEPEPDTKLKPKPKPEPDSDPDLNVDSDSSSSSSSASFSASSTHSTSSSSSASSTSTKPKHPIRRLTPYNPPQNPTLPSTTTPRETCNKYARTGRCRYGSRCVHLHPVAVSNPLSTADTEMGRLLQSGSVGNGSGNGSARGVAGGDGVKGRERKREKRERKGLWDVLVEKERVGEDERVLGVLGSLGRAGAFL